MGLFEVQNKYYLQIISAQKEKHWIIPIPAYLAIKICREEELEIESLENFDQLLYLSDVKILKIEGV
jgi:hypothetical protein